MQYRSSSILQNVVLLQQKYYQKYYDLLLEWLKAWNYRESESNYIFFWCLNVLGLESLWGQPMPNTFYDDDTLKYDDKAIYDNYSDLTPFVSPSEMVAYTSFLMDYSQQTFSIPLIVEFVKNYCKCEYGDIKITNDVGHIYITIPNTELGLNLYNIVSNKIIQGMPFGAEPIIWKLATDNT